MLARSLMHRHLRRGTFQRYFYLLEAIGGQILDHLPVYGVFYQYY